MKLLVLVVVALLAGCATEVVSTGAAKLVPPDRVFRPELARPQPDKAEVVVKRDTGVHGIACDHVVVVNSTAAAALHVGEKVSLYVDEGEHVIGVRLSGLLCPSDLAETTVNAKRGKVTALRSGVGTGSGLVLAPTAF